MERDMARAMKRLAHLNKSALQVVATQPTPWLPRRGRPRSGEASRTCAKQAVGPQLSRSARHHGPRQAATSPNLPSSRPHPAQPRERPAPRRGSRARRARDGRRGRPALPSVAGGSRRKRAGRHGPRPRGQGANLLDHRSCAGIAKWSPRAWSLPATPGSLPERARPRQPDEGAARPGTRSEAAGTPRIQGPRATNERSASGARPRTRAPRRRRRTRRPAARGLGPEPSSGIERGRRDDSLDDAGHLSSFSATHQVHRCREPRNRKSTLRMSQLCRPPSSNSPMVAGESPGCKGQGGEQRQHASSMPGSQGARASMSGRSEARSLRARSRGA
mmetsp:Transcript_75934/g.213938  ORF Transcript_75934/g.213938 Transcript_75934/m.213938 type:complete len:332 (-) Transcript_75934:2-997(-)